MSDPIAGSSNTHAKWLQEHAAWMDASMGYVAIPAARMRDAADEIARLTRELEVQKGVVDMAYIPHRHLVEQRDRADSEFKNFHRLLCERFGYGHDERDWRRDQLSLIEHIANRPAPETFVQPTRERLLDLATELARYFTSGNPIAVERATVRRESDLYLLLRECMPNWQFEPLKAHELKAFVQLCAPHGKDWLTCPECAKAAGFGDAK